MKSWEDMKDFSYVGIKLTKAKTISEGLTKCKIDKLTRQNPVYQHLKIHALLKGRKPCQLCNSVDSLQQNKSSRKNPSKMSFRSQLDLHQRSGTQDLKESQSPIMNKQKKYSYKSLHKLKQLLGQDNLQIQAFKKFDKFKGVIQKFDDTVRRTKSQFLKMKGHSRTINEYFLTQANQIDRQINEDLTLAVAQVKSQRMNMIEEYEKQVKSRKQVAKRVKQMRVPLKFPLNQQQIMAVVKDCRQKQNKKNSKLNNMLYSLYDYKAKANYATKMKIIKQYTVK